VRQYKWGILAPGTIANKFATGLGVVPDAVKYAVGSRDIRRAEAFAKKHGFEKAYGNYHELVNDPQVDIVYVATPHTQHEEAAMACINAGKAVLCEKPIAVNANQTKRMIQCARRNHVFLMEAMWTRFLPTLCKTRELLANGAIGDIRLVYADFGFQAEVNPESRLFAPAYAGGSLLDVGIYNLSFCSMVFGARPERIQSHMVIGGTGVDEETALLFSYKEGQSALLNSSLRYNTPHIAHIIGTNGRIELPDYWHATVLRLYNGRGELAHEFNVPPYESEGYQFEAIEVMRCLDQGLKESPVMPLDESLAIMQTADLIRKENRLFFPCDANTGEEENEED